MKTPILKPGFEFIFALSLIAILGLPPMLMAQDQKDVEIKITNGDTTVNGKNIKELSPDQRRDAMRDIKHLSADEASNNGGGKHRFLYRRRDSTMTRDGQHQPMITRIDILRKDSAGNTVEMRPRRRLKLNTTTEGSDDAPNTVVWEGRTGRPPMREPMMGFAAKNSQTLNYVNTDNDGISTRISFHISDVTNDDLKRMPHIEGPRLELNDLNFVPEFSIGKTLLVFTLPSKTAAEVTLVDSEGKVLWAERAVGGSFTKSFVLGLNGIYYLQVKQGNGVAVKRILKEQ